jgi:hypothetical protein
MEKERLTSRKTGQKSEVFGDGKGTIPVNFILKAGTFLDRRGCSEGGKPQNGFWLSAFG